jgi:hypothetical protein
MTKIIIENAALHLTEKMRAAQQTAMATIADIAKTRLNKEKPPEPEPGSMKWVSDKQERFVKRMFAMGKMKKYVRGRGNGLPWQPSKALNNSYVIMKEQIGEVSIISTAAYARYVVGEEQSQIHRGRWKKGSEVAQELLDSGVISKIIQDAIAGALK